MTDVMEAEVVESTEVVPTAPSNLFRTDDPAQVLARAQDTANALMPVVREKNLTVSISGREHLRVEAWTTLGAMLGVTPVCSWTRKIENGWEARVEARTLDGRVIGAAESECLATESRWSDADDFAIRSMAQTRATSKALASVLRFVATLGGAAGTPAEEMNGSGASDEPRKASTKQRNYAEKLLKDSSLSDDARVAVWRWGQEDGEHLSGVRASKIIELLKEGETSKLADLAGYTEIPVDTSDFEEAPREDPDEEIPF